jgi:hypothetical protein
MPAQVFNPTETKKIGPARRPGKHSSTARRLTLHSSVCGAASVTGYLPAPLMNRCT